MKKSTENMGKRNDHSGGRLPELENKVDIEVQELHETLKTRHHRSWIQQYLLDDLRETDLRITQVKKHQKTKGIKKFTHQNHNRKISKSRKRIQDPGI